jgi:hypothetical protein
LDAQTTFHIRGTPSFWIEYDRHAAFFLRLRNGFTAGRRACGIP